MSAAGAESPPGGEAVLVEKLEALPESEYLLVNKAAMAPPSGPSESSSEVSTSGTKQVASASTMASTDAPSVQLGAADSGRSPAPSAEAAAATDRGAKSREMDTWRDVEEVTVKAKEIGKNVVELASTASTQAAAAVQELSSKVNPGFSQIGSKLSNWWQTFDPMGEKAYMEEQQKLEESSPPEPSRGGQAEGAAAAAGGKPMSAMHLQALFSLPPSESLLEAFPCRLQQTYKCFHNDLTPEMPVGFRGILYITESHVCFVVDDKGHRIPIKLEHSAVKSVTREKARRGEKSDSLKILLGADRWLAVQEFAVANDMESAFALLEHLSA